VESSILLLPPSSNVGKGGNPYLGLGGLSQSSDVLARALSSQTTQREIAARWPRAKYTVQPDFASDGPILVISVDDNSAAAALAVDETLLGLTSSTLDRLQSSLGVRDSARITSTILTKDTVPLVVRSAQLRVVVGAAGLGLGATALIVALVDGLLASRARRRSSRQAAQERADDYDWGEVPGSEASWRSDKVSVASGAARERAEALLAPATEPGL
jgi:hypothetical protein